MAPGRQFHDAPYSMMPAVGAAAVEIDGLEFGWSRHTSLLRIPGLRVGRGERLFVMGPSGSGKSTLLGLISGILKPRTGSIRIIGTDIGSLSPARVDHFRGDHIGYIFQSFNLLPYLSVQANITLPLQFSRLRLQRLADTTPEAEVARLLQALSLTAPDLPRRRVQQLSIGQQQRVAAARALLGHPELLIADEPTSSLDADTKGEFLELLMNECDRLGTTVIFVSHDRSIATRFDRTLELPGTHEIAPGAAAPGVAAPIAP